MFKQLLILAVVFAVYVMQSEASLAFKLMESADVQQGMQNAFKNGLEKFGGSLRRQKSIDSDSKILEAYAEGLSKNMGSPPHQYVPALPVKIPSPDSLSPQQPGYTLQYTDLPKRSIP